MRLLRSKDNFRETSSDEKKIHISVMVCHTFPKNRVSFKIFFCLKISNFYSSASFDLTNSRDVTTWATITTMFAPRF